MWLKKSADAYNRFAERFSHVLHSVGLIVLVVMMFLTAFDVILRYVFNRPISGAFELTEYMMAILVAFSLGYCYFAKGHVTVDFVVNRLSQRVQDIIDSITGLLGLALFVIVTWQTGLQAEVLYHSKLTSQVLFIPAFPFAAMVAFGSAVISLTILAGFINSVFRAVSK